MVVSNTLVTATKRDADGMTVYDHVFEDKGHKIMLKFNISHGPRPEPGSQLKSRVRRAAKEVVEIKSIRDRLGVSVTYLGGLLKIGDVLKDVRRSLQVGLQADINVIIDPPSHRHFHWNSDQRDEGT